VITLRLDLEGHTNFDLVLAESPVVLWRQRGAVRLTVAASAGGRIRRGLARQGVRTTTEPAGAPVAPSLVRAVGTGLAPARLGADDLDVVEVNVVPIGVATARALDRPFRFWPVGARRRAGCRALLRGSDALMEIRRTAWCSRATLRGARHSLRPVLFDRGAASKPIVIRAADGRLTRWIEG